MLRIRHYLSAVFVLILCWSLGGCVLSIHPVVPDGDAQFDQRLLGEWEAEDGSERATVSRGEGNIYLIAYTENDRTGLFEGRVDSLGGRMVLDVSPAPAKGAPPDPARGLMVDGHLLFVLDIGENAMYLSGLQPDTLLAALQSGELRHPYTSSSKDFTLNGTTEELRGMLGPWIARPMTLTPHGKWVRAKGATMAEGPVKVPCYEASAWREADELFRGDPYWIGADGASSVDLGGGRVLWLFGDTWIDPSGRGTRNGARIVSNTLAVQNGTDPARSSMKFYWERGKDGRPRPFIPDKDTLRHWFGNGVRVGDRLVLFLSAIVSTNTGLGFDGAGWTAWMVENPDDEPSAWRKRELPTPKNVLGVSPGSSSVIVEGDYVYAFGDEDPVKSHPLYVVRWPVGEVRAGRLMSPEWWAGPRMGWVPDSSDTRRWPVFENGSPGVSIHYDRAAGRYIAVQTSGFGSADIMLRAAPTPIGPWTAAKMIFRPGEYYRPDVMIYSALAHPELSGADLILTYSTNGTDIGVVAEDSLVYYPRFVKLTGCR